MPCELRSPKGMLLINGICALLAWHALFFWRYYDMTEWWRQNVSWDVSDITGAVSHWSNFWW